jgi:phage terminase small subunit
LGPRRLEPPADLQGDARREFLQLVASVSANHFRPEDLPLLHLYCAAVVQAKYAAAQVEGALQARAAPDEYWLKMQTTALRSMATLSARLRIGPRSRSTNQRSAKSGQTPSAYDVLFGGER